MGTRCSNGAAGARNGVKLEATGTETKKGEKSGLFLQCGSWPGSQVYIQDKYTMHKAELGQAQNKRTYKDGKDNVPCGVTGCVGHVGRRGDLLAPRLQHVLALHLPGRTGWNVRWA